jgi:predicted ATPase
VRTPDRQTIEPGEVLSGRYEVIRPLGEGGMGAVYEVHDRELDESVALKLLHPQLSGDPDYRQRLRTEVRLARRVSHPNVCRVHDLGQHSDQLFVTMELLGGRTLRDLLRSIDAADEPPLALSRKLDLIVQLCAALAAAHRVGIVHGDVKPENLIVESDRAVLSDFGVASPFDARRGRRMVAGTPHYIAPEILRGEVGGPRADIYACGLVAYELLAGRPPFRTAGLRDAMERARAVPAVPPLPDDTAPASCRSGLDRVLARALDGWPGARPETVDRLSEQLALAARGAADDEFRHWPAARPRADAPVGGPTVVGHDTMPTSESAVDAVSDAGRALPRVATALQLFYAGPASVGAHGTEARADLAADAVQSGGDAASARGSDTGPGTPTVVARPGRRRTTDGDTVATGDGDTGVLDLLEATVREHGGHLVASGPGELMAIFGAPRALGDDVVRAARAAFALLDQCVGGRAGLHTGRVELSWQPGGLRARGEALSRARALARAAEPSQVLATQVTSRHFVGRFDTSDAPGEARLVMPGLLARAERYDLPPLHGRDAELARLADLIREACEERSPRAALIVGAPGSGKSRLRLELERQMTGRRELDWLRARASALGERVPFGLLRSASASWYQAAAEAAAAGGPGDGRSAAFAAARQWLEARASIRPVVLTLDDAHWADRASLEFLAELRRTLDRVPVSILFFMRDGDPPDAEAGDGELAPAPHPEADLRVELAPLSDDAVRAIVRRLAPEATDARVDAVVGRAGGNPFFTEELARHLGESSIELGRRADLPAAVELVIQARLDRLPTSARRLAHAASVIGREFDRTSLRAVLESGAPISEEALDVALDVLERRQIVASMAPAGGSTGGEEHYIFHHTLSRDVAYAQLDEPSRRRAHGALAAHLEKTGAASRREPARLLLLARHREASGDRVGARDAYRAAGEIALTLFAHREASEALLRAEALSDEPDAALAEMCGNALLPLDGAAAAQRYQAALELTSNRVDRARLYHALGEVAIGRSDNATAVACFDTGLALLGSEADLEQAETPVRILAARLLGSLGWVVGYEIGDHRRGLPQAERAVALLESQGDVAELAFALSRLAANYMRAGRWRDRLRCNQRHLEIARMAGDLGRQLIAHINLGANYTSLGELDTAASHTREALALSNRTSRLSERALAHNNLGLILADAGDDAGARAELEEALRLATRAGYTRFLPETCCTLAQVALRAGDRDEAERLARRALALGRDSGSAVDQGVALRHLAVILDRRGADEAEVLELLAAAQRSLSGEPYEEARTWAAESKHAERSGRAAEAAALRERAAAVFRELGASIDLARLEDPDDLR